MTAAATKILAELRNLSEGGIALIETSAENILEATMVAIKYFTDKSCTVIVVSASRPYQNLKSVYAKNSINLKKTFVIDCVSEGRGESPEDNVVYIENVAALTKIALALTTCMDQAKGRPVVCIDSISTMLIHNKPDVLARFLHSMMTKMRSKNITGLLFSLKGERTNDIRAEIAQLCDMVITV